MIGCIFFVFSHMGGGEGGGGRALLCGVVCVFLVWLNYVRMSSTYEAMKERNDKDASKLVSRYFNLPNHSKQHITVCGLSLHLGS